MAVLVKIDSGFAETGAGAWLAGRTQPAAFLGTAVRRRRKGWLMPDRAALSLFETTGRTLFSDSARPFLTYIPCAEPVFAVSSKILVAPASARTGAKNVRLVPLSIAGAATVTSFAVTGESGTDEGSWVVVATAGRTMRVNVEDGETLSVRPKALVAYTGAPPSGFCAKLTLLDMILPRSPREMLMRFHGPCTVWIEGSLPRERTMPGNRGRMAM